MKSINDIFVYENSTIQEVLKVIDASSKKIALVVDFNKKMLGTISDGDIRRALLKGYRLDSTIEDVYFKQPTVACIDDTKEYIYSLCTKNHIYQIPILSHDGIPIDLIDFNDSFTNQTKPNKVILMVGGLGERLRPLTEKTPKPMLIVGNKPILHTIVERFSNYGFNDFIFCVNYKHEFIQNYFGNGRKFGVNIEYIIEKKRMGTAGALSLVKSSLSDPFFVMNGDLLTNVNFEDMLQYHLTNKSDATMCVREYALQIPYGVVSLNENDIISIEEKPKKTFFVSAGIYIIEPSVLKYVPKNTFFDMPSFFEKIMKDSKKTIAFPINDYWLDIGRLDEYEKANREFKDFFYVK